MKHWMLVALGVLLLGGCKAEKAAPKPKEIPVTVAQVIQKSVPITVEAVGTVEAHNSVAVLSRVPGQVLESLFEEGQDVDKGAPNEPGT